MKLGEVCEHGQLARSCVICELQKETVELAKKIEEVSQSYGNALLMINSLEALRDEHLVTQTACAEKVFKLEREYAELKEALAALNEKLRHVCDNSCEDGHLLLERKEAKDNP